MEIWVQGPSLFTLSVVIRAVVQNLAARSLWYFVYKNISQGHPLVNTCTRCTSKDPTEIDLGPQSTVTVVDTLLFERSIAPGFGLAPPSRATGSSGDLSTGRRGPAIGPTAKIREPSLFCFVVVVYEGFGMV